ARAQSQLNREDLDYELGRAEREVVKLISGRELDPEGSIAAVQARILARSLDKLSESRSGSAGLALAAVSRRLEECVCMLRLQPTNELTELQERRAARLEAAGVLNARGKRPEGTDNGRVPDAA